MQRRERRPRLDGSRSDCHKVEPELSGTSAPSTRSEASSPAITLSVHPIGGTPLLRHPPAVCSDSPACPDLTQQWGVAPPQSQLFADRLGINHVRLAGFCAVSTTLPVPMTPETDTIVTSADGQSSRRGGGLNHRFGKTVYCVAAEPEATFMRLGVSDGGPEVAYEICVLGRMCRGFRIFQLRSMLGTRIELAYVLVRISFRSEPNLWLTPRQV